MPNSAVVYSYDTNPYDASFTQYGTGRLAAVQYAGAYGTVKEMYSYTQYGAVVKKRVRYPVQFQVSTFDLDLSYTRDNEGRVATMAYPNAGPTYTYTYDTMGRPSGVTGGAALVSGVTYGPAGELLTILDVQAAPYSTERRQYNALGQLTRITIPANDTNPMLTPLSDVEYRYSAAQNDGQITSRKDYVSGEEVVYQYDNVSRLTSAVTTGPEWGLQFSYDGWGNRTEQRVVKGSGPANTFSYNPASNRLTGGPYTYDGNGNITSHPTMSGVTLSYDVENRMATVLTCNPILGPWCTHGYTYAPDNKRVIGDGTYYFWAGNQLIGTYKLKTDQNNIVVGFDTVATYAYFGGRRLGERPDRVGSNGMGGKKYFPYGEEYTASAGDGYKFATYWRESAWNLDYADQRWYSSTLGRFLTADPYEPSGKPTIPVSWNRYSFVEGDPVNLTDPTGLQCDDKEKVRLATEMFQFIFGGAVAPHGKGLFSRWNEQIRGLHGPGTEQWDNHNEEIENMERGLKDRLRQWKDDGCGDPPDIGPMAEAWSKMGPVPDDLYKGAPLTARLMYSIAASSANALSPFFQMALAVDRFVAQLPVPQPSPSVTSTVTDWKPVPPPVPPPMPVLVP